MIENLSRPESSGTFENQLSDKSSSPWVYFNFIRDKLRDVIQVGPACNLQWI